MFYSPRVLQNELGALEFIHSFVETLDRYFGNVCELDIMYHVDTALYILGELIPYLTA